MTTPNFQNLVKSKQLIFSTIIVNKYLGNSNEDKAWYNLRKKNSSDFSSPIRVFIEKQKQNLKKVAFFATMSGSGDKRTFTNMEELTGLTPIATASFIDKKIKKPDFKAPMLNFVENINKKLSVTS